MDDRVHRSRGHHGNDHDQSERDNVGGYQPPAVPSKGSYQPPAVLSGELGGESLETGLNIRNQIMVHVVEPSFHPMRVHNSRGSGLLPNSGANMSNRCSSIR